MGRAIRTTAISDQHRNHCQGKADDLGGTTSNLFANLVLSKVGKFAGKPDRLGILVSQMSKLRDNRVVDMAKPRPSQLV